MESIIGKMESFTMENGKAIKCMDQELLYGRMARSTRAIL